jgi:hypothetical protein
VGGGAFASEVLMRHAGNFNPEWGYIAPAPSFLRTARVFIVAAAIGATASAAVLFSLMDRPAAEASVAARTLVQPVERAPSAQSAPVTAQTQTPPQHAAASATEHADARGAMRPQGVPAVAHVTTGSSAASETGAASSTQHAPIAAALAEAPRIMTAETPALVASESNPAPAVEAAPAPAPAPKVVPIKKPRVVARVAPRYGPRYEPRYEQRYDSMGRGPYASLRQYGTYGGQEY